MSGLQLTQPLRFKGVKSDWLDSLPNSGTEMLTISSTGVVSRQTIPVASFGALTGLPSDNAALQSALDAKLNLSGGTLTGPLVLPAGSKSAVSLRLGGTDVGTGLWGSAGGTTPGMGFAVNGVSFLQTGDSSDGLRLHSLWGLAWTSGAADGTVEQKIYRTSSTALGFFQSGALRAQIVNGEFTATNAIRLTNFNPSAPDISILRNATGPTLETRSAGGLRVRSADGSAAGALDCGAVTASAKLQVNGTVRVDATTTHDIRTSAGMQVATISNANSHCLIRAQATIYPLGLYGNGNGIRIGDGTYTVDLKPDGANNTLGIYTGQGTSSAFSGAIANLNVGAINGTGNIALTGSNPQVRLGAVDQGFVEYSSGALNLGHTYATRLAVNATQVTSLVPIVTSQTVTSGMQTLVADPSTVDITAGLNRMVKNSTSGEVRHWVNDGGIMKSVLFTT